MKNPDYNYVPRGFKKIGAWWYPKAGNKKNGDRTVGLDGSICDTTSWQAVGPVPRGSKKWRIIRRVPRSISNPRPKKELVAGEAIKRGEQVFVGNDGKVWRKGKK